MIKNILLIVSLLFIISNSLIAQTGKKTVFYQSVEWSHNSKSLCFAAIVLDSGKYVNGRWEIYTMNFDGTGLKKITDNNFNDMWPSFSSDDKFIYFQSDRDGNKEIYRINSDGTNLFRITDNPASDITPVCSPDGKKILFSSSRNNNQDLYVMNINGSKPVQLTYTPDKEFNPSWSPDGKKIVYYYEKGNQKDQIFVCNFDGTDPINISNDSLNNIYPAFTFDSKQVIYQSSHLKEKHVTIFNFSDGTKKTFSNLGFFNRCSPDGKYIVYISSGWPQSEISVCKIDATGGKVISKKEEILGLNEN